MAHFEINEQEAGEVLTSVVGPCPDMEKYWSKFKVPKGGATKVSEPSEVAAPAPAKGAAPAPTTEVSSAEGSSAKAASAKRSQELALTSPNCMIPTLRG